MPLDKMPYEHQLLALEALLKRALSDSERLLYLSLADSVKEARDHDLNCRPDPHVTKEA